MRYAMDIDLGACFCVREDGKVILDREPHPGDIFHHLLPGDQILVEVASPKSFVRGVPHPNVAYSLGRWAMWNIAQASLMSADVQHTTGRPLLVAPSDVWTQGYDVKTRHAMVKAKAKNKDLRECEAMLWFHGKWPAKWVPLLQHLETMV